MGLFEEAGRRFERFKQQAEAVAEGETEYECVACGRQVTTSQEPCPECGADEFRPAETEDEQDPA